jgi:hypothetical protein
MAWTAELCRIITVGGVCICVCCADADTIRRVPASTEFGSAALAGSIQVDRGAGCRPRVAAVETIDLIFEILVKD